MCVCVTAIASLCKLMCVCACVICVRGRTSIANLYKLVCVCVLCVRGTAIASL